jgi:surface protein
MNVLKDYCIDDLSKLILSYTYNTITIAFEESDNIRIDTKSAKNIINNSHITPFNKDNKYYVNKCHHTIIHDSIIYKCDIITNIYIKINEQVNISFKGLSTTIKTVLSDGYIGLIDEGYNFYKQYSLTTIPTIINVNSLTNATHMFDTAINFDCDISNWNVSNIKNMSYMFSDAINFNQNISLWNTKNVNNMKCMFRNAKRFNILYTKKWILPKQTNKKYDMFIGINNKLIKS